jgi:hypothetical protein
MTCQPIEIAHLIDDILLFVSLVNWHLTLLLEHSEQLEVSVASHLSAQLVTAMSHTDFEAHLDFAFPASVAARVLSSLPVRAFLS